MRQEIPSKARIEIRLTTEEKAAIQEQAAQLNMNVSDFIRYACKKINVQKRGNEDGSTKSDESNNRA